MNRMTDNDRNWGPFTLGRWRKNIAIRFTTDDDNEGPYRNHLLLIAFGWALRIALPNLIPPHRIRHEAHWDEATVKRLGRNHYFKTSEREFGFSLSDMGNGYDFLQIFYGRQSYSSNEDKTWSKHLPWKQWDCVRSSVYAPDGTHFATEERGSRKKKGSDAFFEFCRKREECPSSCFEFEDYDGKKIVATTRIEEREWHRGTGWFKWLKWFWPAKIRRSLDLQFSAEVGPGKGSWKGGTRGHGIDMLKGETPQQAFERYCEKEHSHKGREFGLKFIGPHNPSLAPA